MSNVKYHLGCGEKYMRGYINVDYPQTEHAVMKIKADEYCDLKIMRFQKDVDEIRSHHVFEHFGFVDSFAMLLKWTQALKVKGGLIVDVPDIEMLAKALEPQPEQRNNVRIDGIIMRLLFGSQDSHWSYHINGWTPRLLSFVLKELGYTVEDVKRYGDNKSGFPNCGVCITACKTTPVPVDILVERAKKLLQVYVVLPREQPLYDLFCTQLEQKVKTWLM